MTVGRDFRCAGIEIVAGTLEYGAVGSESQDGRSLEGELATTFRSAVFVWFFVLTCRTKQTTRRNPVELIAPRQCKKYNSK